MPRYNVHMVQTVSSVVTVDADSPEEAHQLAYRDDDMPGSITHGAFGSASVDGGDWEPVSVTDTNGDEVWAETPAGAAFQARIDNARALIAELKQHQLDEHEQDHLDEILRLLEGTTTKETTDAQH